MDGRLYYLKYPTATVLASCRVGAFTETYYFKSLFFIESITLLTTNNSLDYLSVIDLARGQEVRLYLKEYTTEEAYCYD